VGAVDAKVLRTVVFPKAHRARSLIVEFRANERVTIDVRVVRRDAEITHSKPLKAHPGRWLFTLPLPTDAAAGRAAVLVRFQDADGHAATYRRSIRIPAPKP
jgi:hypothetical protein